jgi:hypothetical protein
LQEGVLTVGKRSWFYFQSGNLTPDEANAVAAVIDTKRKAIETQNLESRIAVLEHAAEAGGKK